MTRHVVMLVLGALLTVVGSSVLAVLLRIATTGAGEAGLLLLVPAAFAAVGIALLVLAIRGMLRHRERRAMPLAVVRAEPAAAGAGRWELADVAGGIARRLQGSPCSVHHGGERIEIRWAGDASQERCELRHAGDGALSHSDVAESALEVHRLHNGVTFRAGPSRRGPAGRVTASGTQHGFDTPDRRAVHAAVDETLALAGWRREG